MSIVGRVLVEEFLTRHGLTWQSLYDRLEAQAKAEAALLKKTAEEPPRLTWEVELTQLRRETTTLDVEARDWDEVEDHIDGLDRASLTWILDPDYRAAFAWDARPKGG